MRWLRVSVAGWKREEGDGGGESEDGAGVKGGGGGAEDRSTEEVMERGSMDELCITCTMCIMCVCVLRAFDDT